MEAFDSDVLILSARQDERGLLARRVLGVATDRIGSVLLLPEVLSKPLRTTASWEFAQLDEVLATFDLKPVDQEIAEAATTFGAKYNLKAVDAVHLATAVVWGAERFHTNNRKDFGSDVSEIEVVLLDSRNDLP